MTTPPVRRLCFETFCAIQAWIWDWVSEGSVGVVGVFVGGGGGGAALSVMYARGYSCAPKEDCRPTTPASAMEGCVRRRASSSAGATWWPETFISSWVGEGGEWLVLGFFFWGLGCRRLTLSRSTM